MLFYVMSKYKMGLGEMTEMYGRYVTSWGGKQVSYKFEGYKDGELVATVEKGAMTDSHLYAKADTKSLIEDETYDVTRIEIKALSQYNNVLPYDNSVIDIETNDVLDVIGPKAVALIGGQIAFWVKTKGVSGEGIVKIHNAKLGDKEIKINVIKK